MTTDFQNAIHIVSGASAAGALKQAHELSSDQILIAYDPLACGPVPATNDIGEWQSIRDQYWEGIKAEFAYVSNAANDLHNNLDRLSDNRPLILWVASSLPEQLLASRVAELLGVRQIDPAKLSLVQVDFLHPKPKIIDRIRSMGQLSPERIRTELPAPRPWTAVEWREYRAAWQTYTSDDPESLRQFLARESSVSVLRKALQRLVHHYPSATTGLAACDEELLNQTVRKGPRAVRIIGYTMGELMETEDFLGDGVLFHRLTELGTDKQSSALVSIDGDPRKMRACDIAITDFGRSVLSGEVNALTVNEADDWVGGVHIAGRWPVPHRQGEELVLTS